MSARTSVTGCVCFPCKIVSVTRVPARPLISCEPKFAGRLASDVVPTATITSPRWSPALAAGDPGNTSSTSSPRDSACTSTPIPLRCGLSSLRKPW